MRKAVFAFVALIVVMAIFVSFASSIKIVKAQIEGDYTIEQVHHRIDVLYNGFVLVNDTVTINVTGQSPDHFQIGLPYDYSLDVLECIAYNESATFPVDLDIPLGGRVGFYGVKVNFNQGTPQVFTVVFVLSNDLMLQDASESYGLSFPGFPSLMKPVAVCNVSFGLPSGTKYTGGTVSGFEYSKQNIPEFSYNVSQVTFTLSGDKLVAVRMEKLDTVIVLDEFGNVQGTDTYRITNKAQIHILGVRVVLPPNASNPVAQDQFGRKLSDLAIADAATNRYTVTFDLPLNPLESTQFSVRYNIPKVFVSQEQANKFALNISLFEHVNYYVDQASISFVFPEGANILNPESIVVGGNVPQLGKSIFQETATINTDGLFAPDAFSVGIVYEYNPLWASFRPTMWVWALAIVGCAVMFVWKRPKPSALTIAIPTTTTTAVRLRPDHLRSFLDGYEEKRKIMFDLESLESRARKGKIPRRRYKVQRVTLETRMNTLSRNLVESKDRIRAAGGKYADLARQLEIAETEMNEVESNIKSIEARHNRGELSLEAYRKLLGDYQRRKEKADTTIKGILLRFREEIR